MNYDQYILEEIISGKTGPQIVKGITARFRLGADYVNGRIRAIRKTIREYQTESIEKIISLHITRYEHIYNTAFEKGITSVAKEALKAKEHLVGIRKDFLEQMVEQMFLIGEEDIYDLDILSEDERKKFFELFKRVWQNQKTIELESDYSLTK